MVVAEVDPHPSGLWRMAHAMSTTLTAAPRIGSFQFGPGDRAGWFKRQPFPRSGDQATSYRLALMEVVEPALVRIGWTPRQARVALFPLITLLEIGGEADRDDRPSLTMVIKPDQFIAMLSLACVPLATEAFKPPRLEDVRTEPTLAETAWYLLHQMTSQAREETGQISFTFPRPTAA